METRKTVSYLLWLVMSLFATSSSDIGAQMGFQLFSVLCDQPEQWIDEVCSNQAYFVVAMI